MEVQLSASDDGLVIIPDNFEASDNYSGHIQLSWTYPPYALSEFFIYRDGVLMDSVETTIRYWYDTYGSGGSYIYL